MCKDFCEKGKEIYDGTAFRCEAIPADLEDLNGRSDIAAEDGMKYIFTEVTPNFKDFDYSQEPTRLESLLSLWEFKKLGGGPLTEPLAYKE